MTSALRFLLASLLGTSIGARRAARHVARGAATARPPVGRALACRSMGTRARQTHSLSMPSAYGGEYPCISLHPLARSPLAHHAPFAFFLTGRQRAMGGRSGLPFPFSPLPVVSTAPALTPRLAPPAMILVLSLPAGSIQG